MTRFRGEMFGSVAIRAYRLRGRYKYGVGPDPDGNLRLRTIRNYVFWPTPEGPGQERELLEEINDASYFPLLDLLFNDSIGNRFVKSRPFGDPWVHLDPDTTVRFCALCAAEQRRDFGVSWWMRDLNLPHVGVCPEHSAVLTFVSTEYVLGHGGLLPHELLASTETIRPSPSTKQVVKAAAVVLLCRASPLIDSNVFKSWVKQEHEKLEKKGHSLNSIVHAERSVSGSLPFFHDDIVCQYSVKRYLAAFAAIVKSPKETVDKLVQQSRRPVHPCRNIKELALDRMFHGIPPEGRALRGPTGVLKEVVRTINECLDSTEYREKGAACLAPFAVEFLLLEELDPVASQRIRNKVQWEKNIGVQTEAQQRIAWYLINEMLQEKESGNIARSPRLKRVAASQPVIPAWRQSYVGAVLQHVGGVFSIATKASRTRYSYAEQSTKTSDGKTGR